jgi:hypothetical protein
MNCIKTKPSPQDQHLSCYRLWMRPRVLQKKVDRRNHMMTLGQYLLSMKK